METIYQGEYFLIKKEEKIGRKTPILHVINNNSINLGEIKWFGAWRKFCFYPANDTVWDNKCLEDLLNFVNKFNSDWRSLK